MAGIGLRTSRTRPLVQCLTYPKLLLAHTNIRSRMPPPSSPSTLVIALLPRSSLTQAACPAKSCCNGTTALAGSIGLIGALTASTTARMAPLRAITWGRCRRPASGCGSKCPPARWRWKDRPRSAWAFLSTTAEPRGITPERPRRALRSRHCLRFQFPPATPARRLDLPIPAPLRSRAAAARPATWL